MSLGWDSPGFVAYGRGSTSRRWEVSHHLAAAGELERLLGGRRLVAPKLGSTKHWTRARQKVRIPLLKGEGGPF